MTLFTLKKHEEVTAHIIEQLQAFFIWMTHYYLL